MKNKYIIPLLLILLSSFTIISLSEKSKTKPSILNIKDTSNLCLKCHKVIIDNPVVHPPADDCSNCHKPIGEQQHPQSGLKGFTLAQKTPELCYSCHDPKNTKKNIHPPVEAGECLTCHSPHSSPNKSLLISLPTSILCKNCHDIKMSNVKHKPVADGNCEKCHDPHQSDFAKLLKANKPDLCIQCHKKQQADLDKKTIHPPFKDDCSACHLHHSSVEAHLLSTKVPDLCFKCHDALPASFDKAKFQHSPLKDNKSCINCHSPHASDEAKLLIKEQKKLCLDCHNRSVTKDNKQLLNISQMLQTSKFIHGAIESEGCTACHQPHTGNNSHFFSSTFPERKYVQANKDSFALCFKCHDSKLLEEKITNDETGFRNGEKGMHFVHINGSKGRSCVNCHNVHASNNPHIIADKVKFENWMMPLNYKTLEKGGSCRPGCHEEKKYER